MRLSLRAFRLEGGSFIIALVILFILIGLATFYYLQLTDKLADYKINLFSSIGTGDIASYENDVDLSEYEDDLSIGATDDDRELIGLLDPGEPAPDIVQTGSIEKIAEKGDSITTLARSAVKDYLQEKGLELSREHKLFMEDYIQRKTGYQELEIGDKISFSKDLLQETLNEANELSEEILEELWYYSELVWNPPLD